MPLDIWVTTMLASGRVGAGQATTGAGRVGRFVQPQSDRHRRRRDDQQQLELAAAPGNVAVSASRSGLSKDSVVDVSQTVTLDKGQLGDRIGKLDFDTLDQIEAGLRLALDLAS